MTDSALRRVAPSALRQLSDMIASSVFRRVRPQNDFPSRLSASQRYVRSPRLWWNSEQGALGRGRAQSSRSICCSPVSRKKDDGYISEHVKFEDDRVEDFLKDVGIEYKPGSSGWLQCQDCPEQICRATPEQVSTKHKESNRFVLGVSTQNGAFHCFRCEAKGNWHEFRRQLRGSTMYTQSAEDSISRGTSHTSSSSSSSSSSASSPSYSESSTQDYAAYEEALPRAMQVLRWLQDKRGISRQTLEAYRVGACIASFDRKDHTCVTFPWFDEEGAEGDGEPVRCKLRSIENKKAMRMAPAPDPEHSWGFFGWNTVTDATAEVVLTEGELDAMAVHQETGACALSLPNGATSLPPALIRMLDRFSSVVLWLDDDAAGRAGVEMCLQKLGSRRCKVVKTRGGGRRGPKDANEALLLAREGERQAAEASRELRARLEAAREEGEEAAQAEIQQALAAVEATAREVAEQYSLKAILSRQEEIVNDAVISFSDFRDDVRRELCGYQEAQGIPFGDDLPSLTAILKGHRPGEMSVFTGRTGQGKTTLLSQLSLDLCQQGLRTLWGSFEVQNAKLVAKMLQQLRKENLRGCSPEVFDAAAEDFRALPMWFLKYFGSTKVEHVLDAMDYAVHAHDVRHVVLDNLQFMTYGTGGDDKFAAIDDTLAQVRRFATESQVHVSLVMHPRKEEPGKEIHMNSVYGSGKATQDSDNVIILQQIGKLRYLDVQKNRFDGTRGKVPFAFNRESLRYEEVSAEEADALAMEEE